METVNQLFKVNLPKVFKSKATPVACAFPELVCGVELETENGARHSDEYVDSLNTSLWGVERDGSLRGDGAYEFISRPIQLQHLIPELENFFKITKFTEANYSDRCSIHVHTNVTDYTQDMLASLALVYTITEATLFQFVNHYKAPNDYGYSRDTNLYCIPWDHCRMNHKLIENIFVPSRKTLYQWQKYTALNLLPITTQGTVEWRHMHGTADMEKFTNWLNIIGSIMKYAKRASLDDVIATVKSLNDTSTYSQFFTDVMGDYLKYDESYASTLSAGVINAKYSLLDWDRSKVEKIDENATKKMKYDFNPFDMPPVAVGETAPAPRLRERNPVRFDPVAFLEQERREQAQVDAARRLRRNPIPAARTAVPGDPFTEAERLAQIRERGLLQRLDRIAQNAAADPAAIARGTWDAPVIRHPDNEDEGTF